MVYSNEIISGEIDHESGKNDEKSKVKNSIV